QLIAKLGSAQSAFHVINQNAAVAAISPQSSPSTPLLSPPTAAAADPVTQLLHQFRLQRPAAQFRLQRPAAAAAAPTSPSVSKLTSSSGRTVVAAVSPTPPPQTQQTKTPTSETKMYTPQAEFFGGETFNFKNDYMMHTVTVSSGMTSPQILESKILDMRLNSKF
uniref:WW domain containing adaptor with coiled-coil n=1 Tax=Romanomermis culicivorax TaxID=13658 RepID=A0A915KM27_ROMCU